MAKAKVRPRERRPLTPADYLRMAVYDFSRAEMDADDLESKVMRALVRAVAADMVLAEMGKRRVFTRDDLERLLAIFQQWMPTGQQGGFESIINS